MDLLRHKTGSRKDGTGSAEGQPPELRDGFLIMRLVMSINYLHIFLFKQGKIQKVKVRNSSDEKMMMIAGGSGRVQTPPG